MELQRIVKIRSGFSLAVRLIDSFTGGAPLGGGTEVALMGTLRKPVRKEGGLFVFTDIAEGDYTLLVTSDIYFGVTVQISSGSSGSIHILPLKPLPQYPFPSGVTLIRACLRDELNRPLAGVQVTASLLSEDCCRARLAEEAADKGKDEIAVGNLSAPIHPGDIFLLQGVNAKGTELCEIASELKTQGRFKLVTPLGSSHKRGAMLLPVFRTRSDERGEVAVAFPSGRVKAFEAELRIEAGKRHDVRKLQLLEGTELNLGTLRL
ncbi:hypothetical protein [Paenibacillus contaminans]|uniref:Uncharacterized protein n=1 Tax=Paenibacillus contaminans TaxID=450362 RepID=A0A329ML40_9BACL|nr:hypothetical protein [Paenibacillus contaminans]RAV20504.1 hypothetical protein DQG23_16225 [Paenibacillus contaminans]